MDIQLFLHLSLAHWISIPSSSSSQRIDSQKSQLLGVSNEIIDRGEIKMDQVSLRRQKYKQESAYFLDSSATCTPVKVELGLIWSELSCRISNDPRSHHHFIFCAFAWKERERSETLPDSLVLWGWVQWKGNLN